MQTANDLDEQAIPLDDEGSRIGAVRVGCRALSPRAAVPQQRLDSFRA